MVTEVTHFIRFSHCVKMHDTLLIVDVYINRLLQI
jgi:hypothetical protein